MSAGTDERLRRMWRDATEAHIQWKHLQRYSVDGREGVGCGGVE
jgi:hypothetical protein